MVRLQTATQSLFGAVARDLVDAGEVDDPGIESPRFRFTMDYAGEEYTLTVGNEGDEGFYCTFEPVFQPGVLAILERARLTDFLRLVPDE